jgi:hypothetical protein
MTNRRCNPRSQWNFKLGHWFHAQSLRPRGGRIFLSLGASHTYMTFRNTLLMLGLMAPILAGCSAPSGQTSTSGRQKVKQLGVVMISGREVIQRDLGGGRFCIIRPTVLPDGSVKVAITIRESGKVLATPSVRTFPDRPFEVSCDGVGVGMTVHVTMRPSA